MDVRRTLTTTVAGLGTVAALAFGTTGAVDLLDRQPPAPTSPTSPTSPASPSTPAPPTPVVPSAPADAAADPVAAPTRIEVPAIGVDERLSGRGLRADGSFDTPDFGDAAWYAPGPRPGEPGGAVVVAHVHGPDGPDVFWDLARLAPGDTIRVHRRGAVATFVVDDVEDVPKEDLPYERIWPAADEPLLRLITCGGQRLPEGGYPDNTVVYAHLVMTEEA